MANNLIFAAFERFRLHVCGAFASKTELENSLAGCYIAFEDENGNPTMESYIYWDEEE